MSVCLYLCMYLCMQGSVSKSKPQSQQCCCHDSSVRYSGLAVPSGGQDCTAVVDFIGPSGVNFSGALRL